MVRRRPWRGPVPSVEGCPTFLVITKLVPVVQPVSTRSRQCSRPARGKSAYQWLNLRSWLAPDRYTYQQNGNVSKRRPSSPTPENRATLHPGGGVLVFQHFFGSNSKKRNERGGSERALPDRVVSKRQSQVWSRGAGALAPGETREENNGIQQGFCQRCIRVLLVLAGVCCLAVRRGLVGFVCLFARRRRKRTEVEPSLVPVFVLLLRAGPPCSRLLLRLPPAK
jgi:hypothetical protein